MIRKTKESHSRREYSTKIKRQNWVTGKVLDNNFLFLYTSFQVSELCNYPEVLIKHEFEIKLYKTIFFIMVKILDINY